VVIKQCKDELNNIKNLIKQIRNIEDQSLRHELCESAIELCDDVLSEVDK
jgi:hypothetical protein